MTKDEALKLALWHEAMAREPNRNQAKREKHEATAKFINEALAQPKQEPVKDLIASHNEICALLRQAHDALALTSYPPQRKTFNHDEFGYWWFEYGSGLFPLEGEDQEEHAYRVATAAWQAAHGIKGD